jgi:hypothetical protein
MVRFSFFRVAALAAVSLFATILPASADDCQDGSHNGSEMAVCYDGNRLDVFYMEPRPSLEREGVTSDSVLFEGTHRGKVLTGIAYVFRNGCQPAGYRVTGRIHGDSRRRHEVRLYGAAPVRHKDGCQISHYANNHNSRLLIVVQGEGPVY